MDKKKNLVRINLNLENVYKLKRSKDGVVLARSRPKGLAKHWTIIINNGRFTIHSTDESTGERRNLLAENVDAIDFQQEMVASVFSAFRIVPNYRYLEKWNVRYLVNPESLKPLFGSLFDTDTLDVQKILEVVRSVDAREINYLPSRAAWETVKDTAYFALDVYRQRLGIVLSVVREYEGKLVRLALFAKDEELLKNAELLQTKYSTFVADLIPQ